MGTINRMPLYQQAYLALRERIANGDIAPGSRVDVQTTADELDISRTPVREAIRQLLQEGLLELERDGRARVYSPSVADLAEIYVARAALEASSAGVALRGGANIDIDLLEDTVARGRRGIDSGDWQLIAEANTDFHEAIMGLSQSQYAQKLAGVLRIRALRYRKLSMQFPERQRAALEGHAHITELLRRRDPEAEQTIHEHVLMAGAWAVHTLKPAPEDDTPSIIYLREWAPDEAHDEPRGTRPA